ncbi:MAG TPA: hypothetical protein VG457_01030, partial [Planctomycetota bacterium]|nr:hypothetical protein [Planctomycetota bacterium]
MNPRNRLRLAAAGQVALLLAVASCRSADPFPREKKVSVEAVFSEREHRIESCMKGLAASYLELQDSVLFVDPDSKIRIQPPSLGGCEEYHAHLTQRVGGQLLDQVFHQDQNGRIEIDLGRFADPETLIL